MSADDIADTALRKLQEAEAENARLRKEVERLHDLVAQARTDVEQKIERVREWVEERRAEVAPVFENPDAYHRLVREQAHYLSAPTEQVAAILDETPKQGSEMTAVKELKSPTEAERSECDNCGEKRHSAWAYETGFEVCAVCLEKTLLRGEAAERALQELFIELPACCGSNDCAHFGKRRFCFDGQRFGLVVGRVTLNADGVAILSEVLGDQSLLDRTVT